MNEEEKKKQIAELEAQLTPLMIYELTWLGGTERSRMAAKIIREIYALEGVNPFQESRKAA